MPTGDFPTIQACNYSNSNYSIGDQLAQSAAPWVAQAVQQFYNPGIAQMALFRSAPEQAIPLPLPKTKHEIETKSEPMASTRRIVRIYVADKDENIPLEKAILHTGSEQLTDLTDQELYFGIPVKDLLDAHNDYRKTVVDKKASARGGKDVFLEPIKIRDLVMTVVNIASF